MELPAILPEGRLRPDDLFSDGCNMEHGTIKVTLLYMDRTAVCFQEFNKLRGGIRCIEDRDERAMNEACCLYIYEKRPLRNSSADMNHMTICSIEEHPFWIEDRTDESAVFGKVCLSIGKHRLPSKSSILKKKLTQDSVTSK